MHRQQMIEGEGERGRDSLAPFVPAIGSMTIRETGCPDTVGLSAIPMLSKQTVARLGLNFDGRIAVVHVHQLQLPGSLSQWWHQAILVPRL